MALHVRLLERGPNAEQTREIPITQSEFLIGRSTDCDLRLHISAISRHHCMIRVSSDEATLIDLGSSNGTYLNGQRIRSQATLHSGDELRLGTCSFWIDLGDGAGGVLGQEEINAAAVTQKLRPPPAP
jgi:pSer/pThr/pTyr-binding forkhead associated (FHA) protein